jgi:hypothetical protein
MHQSELAKAIIAVIETNSSAQSHGARQLPVPFIAEVSAYDGRYYMHLFDVV